MAKKADPPPAPPRPVKRVEAPRPKGHTREQVLARIARIAERNNGLPDNSTKRTRALGLKLFQQKLESGEKTPEQVWQELEPLDLSK